VALVTCRSATVNTATPLLGFGHRLINVYNSMVLVNTIVHVLVRILV